jgi:hypothetical protein
VEDNLDEVAYEVSDWPVGSRLRLTGTLAERGIPWRWEPVLNLIVQEDDDVATEAALDEIEAEELGAATANTDTADGTDGDGGEYSSDAAENNDAGDNGNAGDDEDEFEEYDEADEDESDDDDDEYDDDDDGALAQAAMADLFVAADRLMHEPDNLTAAVDLDTAADVIDSSPAPFGVDAEVWSLIRRQAAAVRAALDDPEVAEVAEDKAGGLPGADVADDATTDGAEADDAEAEADEAEADEAEADDIEVETEAEGAEVDDTEADGAEADDTEAADPDLDVADEAADALIAEHARALRDTLRPWI